MNAYQLLHIFEALDFHRHVIVILVDLDVGELGHEVGGVILEFGKKVLDSLYEMVNGIEYSRVF